ncbi:MAG: flippase-like domain-containing protein [Synergistaceae bacterium]|nr:flippase-like domain-containing protein [Synergistaceae bacterium]
MSVKKGLTIFLLLSVVVCGAILVFSIDKTSFDIFRHADPIKLVLSILLVAMVWLLDALKLFLLTRAAGARISCRLSIELTWINYFGAAITPMQSGGGPFQMYIMYQNGISVGKSIAITLVRTILTMLILGLTIPFALIFADDLPHIGWGARGFIFYVVIFSLVAWSFIVLSLVRPNIVKRLLGKSIVKLKHLGVLKPGRVARLLKHVNREIDVYNENFRAFMTTGRRCFVSGAFVAFVQLLAQLSVMPCMIWSIGFEVMYFECVLIQALFLFLLYFIPTPGGSGAAEGGAALVFSLFVPWNVAGMLGVGWRLLTEYTGIFFGAIVAAKSIGWSLVNQVMSGRNAETEDSDDDHPEED